MSFFFFFFSFFVKVVFSGNLKLATLKSLEHKITSIETCPAFVVNIDPTCSCCKLHSTTNLWQIVEKTWSNLASAGRKGSYKGNVSRIKVSVCPPFDTQSLFPLRLLNEFLLITLLPRDCMQCSRIPYKFNYICPILFTPQIWGHHFDNVKHLLSHCALCWINLLCLC